MQDTPTVEEIAASSGADLSMLNRALQSSDVPGEDTDRQDDPGPTRYVLSCSECRTDQLIISRGQDDQLYVECRCTIQEAGEELPEQWEGQ